VHGRIHGTSSCHCNLVAKLGKGLVHGCRLLGNVGNGLRLQSLRSETRSGREQEGDMMRKKEACRGASIRYECVHACRKERSKLYLLHDIFCDATANMLPPPSMCMCNSWFPLRLSRPPKRNQRPRCRPCAYAPATSSWHRRTRPRACGACPPVCRQSPGTSSPSRQPDGRRCTTAPRASAGRETDGNIRGESWKAGRVQSKNVR